MSATKSTTRRTRKRPEAIPASTGMAFDYRAAAKAENIPPAVLRSLESEASHEFPDDPMMMELHVLRAIKARGRERRKDGR